MRHAVSVSPRAARGKGHFGGDCPLPPRSAAFVAQRVEAVRQPGQVGDQLFQRGRVPIVQQRVKGGAKAALHGDQPLVPGRGDPDRAVALVGAVAGDLDEAHPGEFLHHLGDRGLRQIDRPRHVRDPRGPASAAQMQQQRELRPSQVMGFQQPAEKAGVELRDDAEALAEPGGSGISGGLISITRNVINIPWNANGEIYDPHFFLPRWAHGAATLAAFGLFQAAKARLDASYAASGHPVDYAMGNCPSTLRRSRAITG